MTDIRLVSCVGVDNDLAMLPHFLAHYRVLGVPPSHMHIILHAAAPSARLSAAQAILDRAGVTEPDIWIAPYTSDTMWERRRAMQKSCAAPEDWVLSADVDELHDWPDDLDRVLAWCDAQGVNCVQGPFIDRLSADGTLNAIADSPDVAIQFPLQAEVICHVRSGGREPDYRYGTVKVMALKGSLLPSRGGHHPRNDGERPRYLFRKPLAEFSRITRPGFRFACPMKVHHYKWVDTLVEGTRRRIGTRGVSAAGKMYGETLIDFIARHGAIPAAQVALRRSSRFDALPWRMRVSALRGLAVAEGVARRIGR